jgi:hypothetical protein
MQLPIDLLDFVLEGGLNGFAARLGENDGLLNQALWFDQPFPISWRRARHCRWWLRSSAALVR